MTSSTTAPIRKPKTRACVRCGDAVVLDASKLRGELAEQFERIMARGEDFHCELCVDILDAEQEAVEREERRVRDRARRVEHSGMPAKWQTVTWDSVKVDAGNRAAVDAAREWGAGRRRRGLLLFGPVGRGKTMLAAAAANARLDRGRVRWLSVAELVLGLRMPFSSKEYVAAMRALDPGRAHALVLDDLDKLKPTDHAVQPLYVAVNAWVEADLPLFVTMNRDLDALAADFGDRFGEAIGSRLAGHCDIFEVTGRDRRLT